MPTRTFRERAYQAMLAGGRYDLPWSKTLPASSTTVGQMNCLHQYAGLGAAGTYPGVAKTATATVGGASPAPADGLITLPEPLNNEQALLNYFDAYSVVSGLAGVLVVGDMLAYYPSLDSNTGGAQAMLGTPSTGDNILTRFTDAEGVMIFADVQVALGAGAANLTVTYTDQDGNTGTTASIAMIPSAPNGKIPYAFSGNGPFLRLASGDRGVKSIQSFNVSAGMGAGGTFTLALFKPLLTVPVVQNTSATHNAGLWEGLANLDAVLFDSPPALTLLWIPASTSVGNLSGLVKGLNLREL